MWRKHKRPFDSVYGVSPVIATILLVAMTVVLAATLYMMLPKGSETPEQQAASFHRPPEKIEGTKDYRIKFAKFSPSRDLTQVLFKVWNGTGDTTGEGALISYNEHRDGITKNFTIKGRDFELTYRDQAGDKKIDSGDYLVLSEAGDETLCSGCYYTVAMYYEGNELDSVRWKVI
ncbi:MAG: archaellin/type IV pilin N-terminal domain-containing protein [Thermoplasmata archaeon]